jgi:hypothetical protein
MTTDTRTIALVEHIQYITSPDTLVRGLVEVMPRLWRYRLVMASAFLWAGLECAFIGTLAIRKRTERGREEVSDRHDQGDVDGFKKKGGGEKGRGRR